MRTQIFAAVMFLLPTVALADEIPADLQVKLQQAMLKHLDEVMVDGAYTYVDTKERSADTIYMANIHPMIIQFGDGYFVCSEMVDGQGKNRTADFLVRPIRGEYRVVQMIVNDRDAVTAAMSKPSR